MFDVLMRFLNWLWGIVKSVLNTLAKAVVLVIAVACVMAAEPRLLGRAWPSYLLAAGAGIGIAYVVVHLLPEIAAALAKLSLGGGTRTLRMRMFVVTLPAALITPTPEAGTWYSFRVTFREAPA